MAQSIPSNQSFLKSINIYWILGFLFVGYSVFALYGYGNDDDTYRMLNTWRTLITEGRYVPSRYQGNLIPELSIGLASQIGGFFLANLISVALSISSLSIFYRLLIQITTPLLATLSVFAIGSNPYWVISSATSMDYIYAVFFFVLGLFLLLKTKFRWAGLAFAAAVCSRLTYAPMGAIAFFLYFPYTQKEPKLRSPLIQGFIIFLVASAAFYLPVFFASGMSLSFLGIGPDASGGFVGIIARFVYKNIYFWGLPAFILLLIFFFQERSIYRKIASNPFYNTRVDKLLFHGAIWCILYNQIMFFRLPHEYAYLLPVLFSIVYLIVTSERVQKTRYLSILIGLQLLYGLIFNFDIIQTFQDDTVAKTIHSDSAKVHFSIKEGILIRDLQWRSIYQKYQLDEFNKRRP
jgi:hypothetical protein